MLGALHLHSDIIQQIGTFAFKINNLKLKWVSLDTCIQTTLNFAMFNCYFCRTRAVGKVSTSSGSGAIEVRQSHF